MFSTFSLKLLGHSVIVAILWAISFAVTSHASFLNVSIGDIFGIILTWGYTHQFIVPTVLKGIKTGAVKS